MTRENQRIKWTNASATIFWVVLILWLIIFSFTLLLAALSSELNIDWGKLWENIDNGTSSLEHLATVIGLIIGGIWVYYKFFKGRTFEPRLELSVNGKIVSNNDLNLVIASLQIKNVGLSQVRFQQESNLVRFSSYTAPTAIAVAERVNWNWLKTYNVFERHQWVEPGETIDDQITFSIPNNKQMIFLIEFRVVGGVTNRKKEIINLKEWWESCVAQDISN
jgi:hypothetical protein